MTVRSDVTSYGAQLISMSRSATLKDVYDITLMPQVLLPHISSFEVHAVVYPYSRQVNASHLMFLPYEEYTQDILKGHQSAYEEIPDSMNKVFGILLGVIITLVFVLFYPSGLFSVDSIVSIFGAYFIGKELWQEIETALVRVTRSLRLRFTERYFRYRFETNSTMAHYSFFAKKQRYGHVPLMAECMDFSRQSNSQTLRMRFESPLRCMEEKVHLFSFHINPEVYKSFHKEGFLFGLKISHNFSFLGYTKSTEWFQSIHNGTVGCLDGDIWIPDTVFERTTKTFGRFKWIRSFRFISRRRIVALFD